MSVEAPPIFRRRARRLRSAGLGLGAALACVSLFGCFPFWLLNCPTPPANPDAELRLQGVLLDADSLTVLSEAALGGRLFTDGVVTAYEAPLDRGASPRWSVTAEGEFSIRFRADAEPCSAAPDLLPPDRVELTIVTDVCQQSVRVDITEETVVELDPPDDVIVFKDPILVPACEG